MMNNNLHPKNFIFLCLSAGMVALGQLPISVALGAELAESPPITSEVIPTNDQILEIYQALEIPSLPSLGAAEDYLPIVPPSTPVVAQETLHLELRLGERKVYVFKNDEVIAS